ncbi:hypothetical protein CCR75_007322 [Bremia lactucae]|uniref:Uncharacterized protein n=1 Tax=Bremia lactucae TaxID=4779 RepID=A0A976ICN6_BRELC|nr:hypothetical protein CCR75_007322 [Bremia lactucae]
MSLCHGVVLVGAYKEERFKRMVHAEDQCSLSGAHAIFLLEGFLFLNGMKACLHICFDEYSIA